MKLRLFFSGMLLLVLLVTGCASMGAGKQKANPELAAQYIAEAQKLEQQEDSPAALEKYKLALTVDPENATAKENIERLSQKLSKLADERYNLGMKYYKQGKYGLARNEFLAALKFQPDHPQASRMLSPLQTEATSKYVFHVVKPGESLSMIAKQYYGDYKKFDIIAKFNNLQDPTMVNPGQRIMVPELSGKTVIPAIDSTPDPESSYVVHTLQPGESISKLAQMYYGDKMQFHIIAQFNNMDDATRVSAGQRIKVPKVVGLPFNTIAPDAEDSPKDKSALPKATAASSKSMAMGTATSDTQNAADEQIIAYRDAGIALFQDGKYNDAIFELNKAVEALPNDTKTRGYLARAYYESGKQLFEKQDFKAAQEAFESSHQYDPKCDKCLTYIEKSKIGPLLLHRDKGLEHFNKNEFKQAIGEFELFLQGKPDDNEVRIYLSKSYYQQAMGAYNKGEFLEAKKGFESALKYDSACEKCSTYIRLCADSFKEAHYNKGIVYYGKQQLSEAIAEWEMVEDIDPNYKELEKYLKQARKNLEKLKEIKAGHQ